MALPAPLAGELHHGSADRPGASEDEQRAHRSRGTTTVWREAPGLESP